MDRASEYECSTLKIRARTTPSSLKLSGHNYSGEVQVSHSMPSPLKDPARRQLLAKLRPGTVESTL